jgi:site-specific DNA-methyltransferase (adenine-specific)
MEKIGYEFHQDIIWHKCTAGVKRAGSVIQKPYPGYYYPNIMTEYILLFKKPGPKIYRWKTAAERDQSKIEIDSVFTRDVANNIWNIAPVPPGTVDQKTPTKLPAELIKKILMYSSEQGDIVLDNRRDKYAI